MAEKASFIKVEDIISHFKEENPTLKVGFSPFASQRPKWCILAGQSVHTLCVCTYRPNINVISSNLEYKDLMSMIVCDVCKKSACYTIVISALVLITKATP